MKVKCMAGLCALGLAASAAAGAGDGYIEYTGSAIGRRESEFLYGERHFLRTDEGRLAERTVLYTCANGAPFARKLVRYVEAAAPDFVLDDASNGMQEGVRTQGKARTMFFKASGHDVEKSAPVPDVPGLVVDAGFDAFIQAHWNELVAGNGVPLRFLVPSRLQEMNFEVRYLHADHFDGRSTEVFRMKLSGILGWFFSGIDVAYDAADHQLVHYQGLSDLRGPSGDNFEANIVFHANDRKPSSAQAMAAAQAAPLAPCQR